MKNKFMNSITEDEMYDAIVENNDNYDGLFFYAVKSTGIYCRPSCKSKAPLRENVEFYKNADEAVKNGYRPCKRCRSDLLEYEPIKKIANDMKAMLDMAFEMNLENNKKLNELGVSRKRLVQIFKETFNITPSEYINNLRLSEAKRLLIKTDNKVIDIAYMIGFNSLSAFYRFFKTRVGITPKAFRNENKKEKKL